MSLIKDRELKIEKLRNKVDVEALGFKTTKDIAPLEGLIGQERAVKSINFGLAVPNRGYNIFIVGEPGSGRMTYSLEEIKRRAALMAAPDDWVYVYNFDDPGEPLAINLSAGKGRELAKETETAIEDLKITLAKAFDNNEYEDNKAQLVKAFQDEVNVLMEDLRKWAESKNFAIKRTPQGFVNLPMLMAKPVPVPPEEGAPEAEAPQNSEPVLREMQQEEFETLPKEKQDELQKVSEEISQRTLEILRLIREREKDLKEKIKNLESEICRTAITPILGELKNRHSSKDSKLEQWLGDFAEDVIENFSLFLAAARDESADIDFTRYEVNPFVSNDPTGGAPVVREINPIYYNLIGKTEYESRQGNLYTDFRKITPGAIHRANGGFLLLEADDLLRQFMSWDALKRVLRSNEISIENLGEQLGYVPVSSLRPEPIPVDIKVVIIGTPYLYYLLNIYDPEFQKIFKITAAFDTSMCRSDAAEKDLASFIAGYAASEIKMALTADAVGEVIEWASRLVENQNKMTTQFNKVAEVICEAAAWAQIEGKKRISGKHVVKAIEEKIFRSNLWEEKILEGYKDGVIKIETEGSVVGQVNGLVVSETLDHSFGAPVRITANVFMGQEGVVNIEREVNMTGPIHNKGLMILTSYLGRMYAQEYPISMSARIAFEQTYGGVEGDSASSTELYCMLSALSGVPLKQNIAVTGSVDQFGNVQPIGGVNEKIEGFFRYCKVNGLTGSQGVMIPVQNEQHLMLHSDVVAAVKKGKFHIWSVRDINEGIEILTDVPAGSPDKDGNFPDNSVHGKVQGCLKSWFERSYKLKKKMDDMFGPQKKKKNKTEDAKESVDSE